ncbi:tetratricopeptide repeat protein, partial [Nonomuraea sp. K274]
EPERARLLITIAMERRADAGRRGDQAAREAEAIARRMGDPALLAYALNGRYMQTFHRAGLAAERAGIGEELLDLAARHEGLVTFEVLGHLILIQAGAALADLATADRHAAAADRLAERYGLPLVGVFTTWYAALRLAVTGRRDEARTAYRTAAARLTGIGMPGLEEGILPLALLSVGIASPDADWGPYERWSRPLLADPGPFGGETPPGSSRLPFTDQVLAVCDSSRLTHAGEVPLEPGSSPLPLAGEAHAIPESPGDLLLEVRTCLHAMVAIRAGDLTAMERLYARLLPAADELAGAGSGLLTFGPTAQHLGDLSAALGRYDQAAGHYRHARAIAERAGAPHWAATAGAALHRLGKRS